MEGRRPAAGGWPWPQMPIGFRFRPTDDELLLHYLRRKALACPLPADIIPVADLARLHPWELIPPAQGAGDEERFFFHLPATRCWRRGGGAARAAATGVWRPSGKEKPVASPRCGRPIGVKRTLVFFHGKGKGRGKRTAWAMHEYRLLPAAFHPFPAAAANNNNNTNPLPPPHRMSFGNAAPSVVAQNWVVCRIFKRAQPARAGRFRGGGNDADAGDSPSSPSSCVTDTSEPGDQQQHGHDDEQDSGSSSSSAASN